MRYIGLDIGIKKTGIAVSDGTNTFATPQSIIETTKIYKHLLSLREKYEAFEIVLGDARNQKGVLNKEVGGLIAKIILKLESEYKIHLQNEWFSSKEAGRYEKGNDAKAAAIILQRYLDRIQPAVEKNSH